MASREELIALRELALTRGRAAGKKVSRHKSKGVDIANTKLDPRVNPEKLKRYTTPQLKAYIAKVDKFVSRETQYVAGARGTILPMHGPTGVRRHDKLQRDLNKAKAANLAKIAPIKIGDAAMTVGERVEMTTPKHPVTAPPSSYAPHIPFTRSVKGITSEKALKKLVKDLESKQGQAYFDKKHKSQFKAARKMVKGIRNKGLSDEFKTLTPKEFDLLWNYTNFAEVSALDYVIRKSMLHDEKELAWYDVALDTQLREARKRIGEIKKLNLDG